MVSTRNNSTRITKQQSTAYSRQLAARTQQALSQPYISRSRFAAESQQAQNDLNILLDKLSSTSNIKEQENILNNAPSSIKSQTNSIRNELKLQYNETLNNVTQDYNYAIKQRAKWRERVKDKSSAVNKRNFEKWDTRRNELNNILSEIKSGKTYSYDSIKNYIVSRGNYAGRQAFLKYEEKQARQTAQRQTMDEIKKAGLVSVIDRSGKLLGYRTPEKNYIEYRFDKSGNAKFYKSPTIKEIKVNGNIVGYKDTLTKQSIAKRDIEEHLKDRVIVESFIPKQIGTSMKTLELFKVNDIIDSINKNLVSYSPRNKLQRVINNVTGSLTKQGGRTKEFLSKYNVVEKTPPIKTGIRYFNSLMTVINPTFNTNFNNKYRKSLYANFGSGLVDAAMGTVYILEVLNRLTYDKSFRRNLGSSVMTIGSMPFTPEGQKQISISLNIYRKYRMGNDLKRLGNLLSTQPEKAVGYGAALIADLVIGTKVGKAASSFRKDIARKILNSNPRLLRVVNNKIVVNKRLILKLGGVQEGAESLSKQLARGGTRATAISAQSRKLVGLVKRKKVIRKPLPMNVEKKLSKNVQLALKKFDKGQLTNKEILNLNSALRQETKKLGVQAAGIDLLERSTYFDPDGLLRKSRLAIQKDLEYGNLFDLFSGKASIFARKSKPQILYIDEMIESLPKTKEFSSIRAKLSRANRLGSKANLTKKELAILSRWQVTPSGKLKAIGSTTFSGGIEREVTIAPKEAIKRVKRLGTVVIDGERIPIIAVKIVKGKENIRLLKIIENLKKKIKALRNKSKKLKTKSAKSRANLEVKKLEDKLDNIISKIEKSNAKKDLAFFLKERRIAKRTTLKKYPLGRRTLERASDVARLKSRRRTTTRRPVTRQRVAKRKPVTRQRVTKRKPVTRQRVTKRKPVTRQRVTTRRPVARQRVTTRRPVARQRVTTRRPVAQKKKVVIPSTRESYKQKKLMKSVNTYYVVEKKRGKFVKLYPKPLRAKDAKDLAAYKIDNNLSRTAFFVPIGKKKNVLLPPEKIRGYYSKVAKKLRPYKIKYGKKKQLVNGFIEKKKYFQDTKQERLQASMLKRKSKRNKNG